MRELTKSLEDYLEAIYIFETKNGFSRVKEISNFLGVSLPSVNKAIKELEKKNLATHERYGYIKLTEKGKNVAAHLFKLHFVFFELFKLFGVDEKKAERYACYIEHIIEKKDVKFVADILDYYKSNPNEIKKIKNSIKEKKNGSKSI
jgi:DtxR family Mn-dependent transcriptional regulator